MTKYIVSVLVVRLVLPLSLLISIALRPFGLSFVYLLCFLTSPLISVPKRGGLKYFWWYQLLIAISCLLLMSHAAFHIVLSSFPPYGSILEEWSNKTNTFIYDMGLVSYNHIDTSKAILLLCPELIMTTVSTLVYVFISKSVSSDPQEVEQIVKKDKFQKHPFLISTGKYVALFCILLCGIMKPSIVTGIYYLVFLGTATAWAVGRPLGRYFAAVGRVVMVLMALHMIALFVYQFSEVSSLLPKESLYARMFGLTPLVNFTRNDTMIFKYQEMSNFKWRNILNPFIILITYYILALETRQLFKPKLLRRQYAAERMSSRSSPHIAQSSTGSVILFDRTARTSIDDVTKLTFKEDMILMVLDFFQIVIRSSYIPTTITMMAWSILYHSWLGFVFLMWANIVWLRQDQRSFMLKTSPILVCYACLLLLLNYIYALDLEKELPSNVTSVNLRQIGIGRAGPDDNPFLYLLIRSLFTCVFWVTLRQRVQEVRERRLAAAAATAATAATAPSGDTLSMSTVANTLEARAEKLGHGHYLHIMGKYLRHMCARYWIYVVVIMLFVIGITGERMTIFRITYMALFLWFILLFQISWYWWRRLLYAFWITVIMYSMTNLMLIYIYQFDNFSKLIEKYLMIDQRLQNDLGLEPYLPGDLFVKLLTPTLFLIMTIIQVHYFHKDFLAISDPISRAGQSKDPESSVRSASRGGSRRSHGAASTIKDDIPQLSEEEDQSKLEDKKSAITEINSSYSVPTAKKRSSVTDRPSTRIRTYVWRFIENMKLKIKSYTNLVFVYIEIHFIKIIFLSIMLLCVLNVCAMHVPIMLIISPALLCKGHKQRYIILLISTLISIYLMAKMIYQIEYIQHSFFESNCTEAVNDTMNVTTYNNAEWMGFTKATHEKPLVVMLKGYIGLIAAFTFYSLVQYRQQIYRQQGIIPQNPKKVVFENITRKDADKDILHCLKYLINYGYYKFGVETTLICVLAVIGSRMDVYAVLYSIWLLILVCLRRKGQSRVWPIFTACITILVPIQYMLAVGFMPYFCVHYPWEGQDQQMKRIRNWLFLPYAAQPPYAMKLIFDYILLLFASRQIRVFRLEKIYGHTYDGGSNEEDIGTDWESPQFVHPVPDFLGYVGSWLDIVKRLVFLGMLWLTLAIMFLTGTNRVNLFSMGYLIGSFIFLWQGTDFYLRPKKVILLWWSWLLYYNVSVVVVKAVLQIPGCIFSSALQSKACWLVQLLGIGCVDKFAGRNIAQFIKMQYTKDATCSVPQEDIGLAWDGVCFAFLIIQRRLFHSYYFFRVIDESKATTMLASRGAELIEELRQKQMNIQEEQEVKILEKIKVKMERIKANQKKIHGFMAKEPPQHDAGGDVIDTDIEVRRRNFASRQKASSSGYRQPTSHQQAVRSGDYYMFDEFDDTDLQVKDEKEDEDEDLDEEHRMGIGKQRKHSIRERTTSTGSKESQQPRRMSIAMDSFADSVDVDENETWVDKLLRVFQVILAFINSFMISLAYYLLKLSRDYRYVSRALSIEKKILKEKKGFGIGIREGIHKIWEPLPDAIATVRNRDPSLLGQEEDSMFKQNKSAFIHLCYALWYVVIAHTDIVCYLMVFINQIQSATILSIPLPLMVFLWGTLTIPRPTKTFWVTLIAYTEVIVLIKSMFQFEILPWNEKAIPANMPFTAPRIIGIERKTNYALYDLLLLLIIFLHRFMLKSLGLWKETTPDIEIREDADYIPTKEDTQMIMEGKSQEVGKKYLDLHAQTGPKLKKHPGPIKSGSQISLDNKYDLDPGEGTSKLPEDYNEQDPVISVTTTLAEARVHYPTVIYLSMKRYLRPCYQFFKRILAPGARVTADIYAYMFLCDFFNFLVVIFGFAAFGTHQGDGGVQTYLEENKVPIPFLVMLILQFCLIVIDRALYLRKFILGKILFQYALIIGVHVWMFFVLPFITERTFNALLPPPMWYMVKCIYLLLSAYQIRCGYPRRIIGNFLCKSYHFINMLLFRGFMAVPFLFELRTLMDWIWTDTSMTLMDWLKMEDIFASVYLLKCSRQMEDEFPQPRGTKKPNPSKYLMGGSVLAFVIAIIWFPLVFFAFGNTVGQPNPPTDVTVKIRIGPFLPVYQMSAQSHNIDVFTENDYNQLSNIYAKDRTAQTFLANYMYNDIAVITINPNSTMTWDISPPELDRLKKEAASNATLVVKFTYVITHPSNAAQNPPTMEDSREQALAAMVHDRRSPERDKLRDLLAANASADTWINVNLLFPKFVKVFNKGQAKPASQLTPHSNSDVPEEEKLYRDVQLRLERENGTYYWRVRESCHQKESFAAIPYNNCDMLVMYTFNDKLFPETLNFISGSGIIGLYTTFVFLAARVLRGFFSGIYTKIMFDDLPNVDRVLQLCLDIYLVREAIELSLEEDLFAKLVFLYRSPETMIKWSRPKDDTNEQRALPPSR